MIIFEVFRVFSVCQFKYCVFIYVKLENEECDLEKKRKNEIVETKRPWAKNKKAAMLGLVHEADKKFIGKNI